MESPLKILKRHRIRPVKRLGQSFLVDNNITSRIVNASKIGGNDTVVEIGAGLGAMTSMIAERAKKVIALEIDPKLVNVLNEELKEISNIEIIHKDILRYDFSSPLGGNGKIKIIGNIPYNVSSQILFRLIEFRDHISSATLMFQKEVADRIAAAAGTKEYGILSVIIPMYAVLSTIMTVPPLCFHPKPKVDSSVLNMDMRERPLFELPDQDIFLKTVKTAFSKRRKTLANNLKSMDTVRSREMDVSALLDEAEIDGRRRGETLTVEEFGRLAETISRSTWNQ
ncbi:MAG: 16S rRNA (adenine(1518)-N(6)/adenine(1519)-N(6))-dimethyltransferase RsmA [Thermodesulfobacteriota bacterium]|nr:16S rRNA (adenine(1518)-N(6)/adenine(1519)-N(6))-dimethyltransferase RsmA [Thermodesulfobacteriota bacterium]